ncbi:MAG: thioredoxin family protein [Beijerinckiaceae bacterium]
MMNRRSFLAMAALAPAGAAAQPAPQGSRLVAATLYDDYNAKGFERWLSARRSFIVHVHADWCSACRMQEARLKTLLADPAIRRLPFIRVDFDHDQDFRRRYRITAQSTLLAFKDGREIARSVGETNTGALRDFVVQVI